MRLLGRGAISQPQFPTLELREEEILNMVFVRSPQKQGNILTFRGGLGEAQSPTLYTSVRTEHDVLASGYTLSPPN